MGRFGNKRHYLPALIWSVVILAFTSIPDLTPPSLGFTWQDKFEHFTAYAIFGGAITYANIRSNKHWILLGAVVFCSLFGILDEIHQHWIPGRSTDPYDWIADTAGALLGGYVILIMRKIWLGWLKAKTAAPE
jgi:VanZ family protein